MAKSINKKLGAIDTESTFASDPMYQSALITPTDLHLFNKTNRSKNIEGAISLLRRFGSDAHLWLPGGDVKTYGPELVVNGGFDSDTSGWAASATTLSVVSGAMRVSQASAVFGSARQLITELIVGRSYELSFSSRSVLGTLPARLYARPEGYDTSTNQLITADVVSTSFTTQRVPFTATNTTLYLRATCNSGSVIGDVEFDNISVREITSITSVITNGLTTGNYLESTGNRIATVDNPAGLVLDALGSVGSELFSADGVLIGVGWSKDGSTFTTTGVTGTCQLPSRLTAGKTYKYSATITGGSLYLFLGSSSYVGPVTGEYSWIGVSSASEQIMFQNNSAGVKTITNISVREVTGIHLTQATTASKPILRRGLVNLLTYSGDFTNAAWTKHNVTITPNAAIGTSGALSASKVVSASATGLLRLYLGGITVPSGSVATLAMVAKKAEFRYKCLSINNDANHAFATFDLESGLVTNSGGLGTGVHAASSIYHLGSDWYMLTVSGSIAATVSYYYMSLLESLPDASPSNSVSGNGVSGVYIESTALFQGTLTAQQIIDAGGIPTTTTAAASNPSAGRYSWGFDGSNDSLTLGSVPFQMADDWWMVASVKGNSASGYPMVINSCGADPSKRVELFFALGKFAVSALGSQDQYIEGPYIVGSTVVMTAIKRGNIITGRVNGAVAGSPMDVSSNVFPTLTASAIGATPALGNQLSGNIYFADAGKGTLSDSEILLIEKLAASAAGITI